MRALCRTTVVLSGLVAAAALVGWQLAPLVRKSARLAVTPGADPSRALVAWVVLVCAALVGAWWLWLLGSTAATALAVRDAAYSMPQWLLAPRTLRVALGVAVGTTAVGTLTVTAPYSLASPAEGHQRPGPVLPAALAGLRLPDRVTGAAPQVPGHSTASSTRSARVRPGDSLWTITAALLPRPTAVRVARTWPRLYAANRAVIGPDPDLIRPGARLAVPAALHRHESTHQGGAR